MEKLTFEDVRQGKNGAVLLYEYVRGSTCQGINTPTSDIDHGGVYMCPPEQLVGLGFDYEDEVSSEKHDDSWFELNKFMRLLCKSNPTVLEALFVDDEFVIYEHPIMTELKKNRDLFLTKECFKPFGGYAVSQIEKARGLNKKIAWDKADMVRKTPMDFCYTFCNQGSKPMEKWLEERGLDQRNCGLVNVPNMPNMYGVYYDWGQHMRLAGIDKEWFCDIKNCNTKFMKTIVDEFGRDWLPLYIDGGIHEEDYDRPYYTETDYPEEFGTLYDFIEKPKGGYCGIIAPDGDSNTIRFTAIPDKYESPICFMSYNANGYESHCRRYKEYEEWKQKRNKVRYENNLGHDYDCYLEKETEFLTPYGWRKYDEIKDTDLIASINSNHELEFVPIINRFDGVYNGDIYTYESRYTRFSVTPNHKLYLSKCHRSPNNNFSIVYDNENAQWNFISVEDYFNGRSSFYHEIKNIGNNKSDNIEYTDDFIILLGCFLSEGTYYYKGEKLLSVRISQIEGNRLCRLMDNIKTIDIKKYCYNKRGKGNEITWECKDEKIIKLLLECNGRYSFEKDIPQYVYTFSKRQFDLLFNAMICGDGTEHKKKGHRCYYTYSPKMAKSLQTLLTLNGYNAQMYGGEKGSYCRHYKSSYNRKDGKILPTYQIFISKDNYGYNVINKRMLKGGKTGWKKEIVTNERIVCFENINHTLVTRNGNKMAFHSNSKNMSHSFRLLQMCIEIANGETMKVKRTEDREFLLDIRAHKYSYEELMTMLNDKKAEMDEAIKNSAIKETVDVEKVNEVLVNLRKEQFKAFLNK